MNFIEFCKSCEKIACSSPRRIKLKLLKYFIEDCRQRMIQNPNCTIFSVFRLLLPHIDRSRSAYGVKEVTLAKLYIKILCLDKSSTDAQRLVSYRYIFFLLVKLSTCDYSAIIFPSFLFKSGCQQHPRLLQRTLQKLFMVF